MFKSLSKLPRGVWAISLSSMLISMSTSMTYSVSPFFLTGVLGLSMCSFGSIEGFAEMISQFSKLCAGLSGDVSGKKKPTLMLGFFLAMISKPLFILSRGAELIIVSKVMERISNGVIATPRDAYVAECTPKKHRGSGFGMMMATKTLGLAIGSFFVGLLLNYTCNYRIILWIGLVPCLLSLWVLWYYLDDTEPHAHLENDHAGTSNKKTSFFDLFKDIALLPARYWTFILVATVFMCGRFSDGFLVLRLSELGAPTWLAASTVGIFNLTSAFCCLGAGMLSDYFERNRVLYFSFIGLVAANICFLYATGIWLALVGVVLWGMQRNTSLILFSAIISDLAPKRSLGTALGIYYFLTGIIAYVASRYAGIFADQSSLATSFKFSLIISVIALGLLVLYNTIIKNQNRNDRLRKMEQSPVLSYSS